MLSLAEILECILNTYYAVFLKKIQNTAVQGGFDWSHDSGFYLGYWGSNLGYTYQADAAGTPHIPLPVLKMTSMVVLPVRATVLVTISV